MLHTLWHLWRHPRPTRKQLVAFRNRKLRCLIRHAYENVRYYRDLFDRSRIKPGDVSTVSDLGSIPLTDKNDLRACATKDILTRGTDPARIMLLYTSGSTGRPFLVRRTQFEDVVVRMFYLRALRQFGLRISDRHALVTLGRAPGERRETFLTRLWKASHVYRRYPVQCLQPADEICHQLERVNPDAIIGYSSVLAHVAPLMGSRLSDQALRFIIAGGDALTAGRRRAIERGFGVRAFDMLGAHECSTVAWECPETGLYHICDDNVIVEILRDGRPAAEGESGEVVVTALHCYAMPFIRYRMGDIVVKGPETCPCGQPFSTLRSIGGRVRDYLLLPDGRRAHALEAIMPVITADVSWLDQYQLTQEAEDRFVLRIAPLGSPLPEELEAMRKIVAERLGRGATLSIELVDHIAFEPSGKFKECRCLVRAGGE